MGDAGVLALREAFREIAQLAADRVLGQRHDRGIMRRDRGVEHARKVGNLLQAVIDIIRNERVFAVADGFQIGDQVLAVLGRKTQIEQPVEMGDHGFVGPVAPAMEIGRAEIGVEERRRLEQAESHIVLLMVDESCGRDVAGGTAEIRVMRERFEEQRLAALFGVAGAAL